MHDAVFTSAHSIRDWQFQRCIILGAANDLP